MAWAVAALRFFHGPLLSAIAGSAADRLGEATAPGLANLVWAFAKLV